MARRKKPENESFEEATTRQQLETISNSVSRSEKTSWNRKMDNMVKLLARLRPIEEQIIELQVLKIPVMDEVSELRLVMVKECVHPYDHLAMKDGYAECKFCNKRIGIVGGREEV